MVTIVENKSPPPTSGSMWDRTTVVRTPGKRWPVGTIVYARVDLVELPDGTRLRKSSGAVWDKLVPPTDRAVFAGKPDYTGA